MKLIFCLIKGYLSDNKLWTNINVEHILWHQLLQEKSYHFSMKYDKIIIHSECANYQKNEVQKMLLTLKDIFSENPPNGDDKKEKRE